MSTGSEVEVPAPAGGGGAGVRSAVVVGALGVVFGDIGTSPIYTIQTVFNPDDPHPVPLGTDHLYGVVSLIFWSVMIIVTLTYVTLVMHADNDGEGGIMALITLLRRLTGGAAWPYRRGARRARNLRRRTVLRRQHDHSGDLGAVGGGGSQGGAAGARGVDRADHGGDHHRAVRGAAPGYRGGRADVRAGDDRLVRGDRRAGCLRYRAASADPQGALADVCALVHGRALRYRVLRARGDRAVGHRRRGAVRGHGPFRAESDHPGLAGSGVAACAR